jgi:hypothetical protein
MRPFGTNLLVEVCLKTHIPTKGGNWTPREGGEEFSLVGFNAEYRGVIKSKIDVPGNLQIQFEEDHDVSLNYAVLPHDLFLPRTNNAISTVTGGFEKAGMRTTTKVVELSKTPHPKVRLTLLWKRDDCDLELGYAEAQNKKLAKDALFNSIHDHYIQTKTQIEYEKQKRFLATVENAKRQEHTSELCKGSPRGDEQRCTKTESLNETNGQSEHAGPEEEVEEQA